MKKTALDSVGIKDSNMLLLLCYEVLFGLGKIQGGGKVKREIMAVKPALLAALEDYKRSKGAKTNQELLPESVRGKSDGQNNRLRYARVNRLRTSLRQVKKQLCASGEFEFVDSATQRHATTPSDGKEEDDNNEEEREETAEGTQGEGKIQRSTANEKNNKKRFWLDEHVADLLVFEVGTDLHDHELVKNAHLILQDKASCFPALILNPQPDSHLIDACSAPGNKTTHAAAMMSGRGRVDAFEINEKRCALLKRRVEQAGGDKCIRARHESFLDADVSADGEFGDVRYVLLDPTCSGSGMVSRLEYMHKKRGESDAQRQKRVQGLAEFQKQMLDHALSFANVQRVSYSTCSVHKEENELVVQHALQQHPEFRLVHALPTWPRRGLPLFPGAEKCVRVCPQEDKINGFFVALFERRSTTSKSKKKKKKNKKRKQPEETDGDDDQGGSNKRARK
eukprot:TRINITY_DN67032_c6_g1_i1.p1 TRINITY_DN67032_c6_g1~~TRINITY_DN67032_c6_g1_i1.p1  ORF type:complete len:452 (+),score=206.42 TRINITY_DN67032_c6_g1_i1:301-1656(+)